MYQSIEVQELLTPTEEDKVFLKEERIGKIIKSFSEYESSLKKTIISISRKFSFTIYYLSLNKNDLRLF